MAGAEVTRRIVLNAGLLAAAGIALSSCGRGDELPLEVPEGDSFSYFTPAQAAVLSDVANIMIPRTETVGATDTGTILYLDQLMQSWASEATRLEIGAFVESLDAHARTTRQADYLKLSDQVRRDLLKDIDTGSFSETSDSPPIESYKRVKWLIFHIHYSSEAANPDFVLIPGQYRGDVSEAEYLALVEDNRY